MRTDGRPVSHPRTAPTSAPWAHLRDASQCCVTRVTRGDRRTRRRTHSSYFGRTPARQRPFPAPVSQPRSLALEHRVRGNASLTIAAGVNAQNSERSSQAAPFVPTLPGPPIPYAAPTAPFAPFPTPPASPMRCPPPARRRLPTLTSHACSSETLEGDVRLMGASPRAMVMPARPTSNSHAISSKRAPASGRSGARSGSVWHTVATVEPCDFAVGSSAWRR